MNFLRIPAMPFAGIMATSVMALGAIMTPGVAQTEPSVAPVTKTHFTFEDIGEKAGLFPHAANIGGHGAGWGDVDGDGWIDLYIGTFDSARSKPNLFFRNQGEGKFSFDEQETLRVSTRATGVVFADLDNDGDLDLYIGSMPAPARPEYSAAGNTLLRNDGGGQFTNISAGNGACPPAFGGRSATVLDYDGDGLLDILAGEDPTVGFSGSRTKSTRLFRNLGNLQFEDVSRAAGLPEAIPGYGVAAADVNNDTWPGFFIAADQGGNVLFLNNGDGTFRAAPGSREIFAWDTGAKNSGNMVCGVAFGDVNRDGLLDIVLGQHYKRPWIEPVSNRLYLNRGLQDGNPTFEDITESVGLKPLPMKAPHVEIQDFDNDGWPDLYASLIKFDVAGKPHPLIFQHRGLKDGLPQFSEDVLAVNEFPTAEDQAITNTTQFFDKMIAEQRIVYTAPGPSGDFDNDGRLDLFLPNWWTEGKSLLLHNQTPGGNWLQLQADFGNGINRMGIGTKIKIYPAGKLGDARALLGVKDIATGYGYASGQPAMAHFGLGKLQEVDVEIILPHGKGRQEIRGVKANQRLTVKLGEQRSSQRYLSPMTANEPTSVKPSSVAGKNPLQTPLVGAIRWDAWHGDQGMPGRAVQNSLGPRHWHHRLPFFAEVLGEDQVRLDGSTQAIMDQEIEFASRAGLDYWAFVTYPFDNEMSLGLKRYLSSSKRKQIQFCLLVEAARLQNPDFVARQVELMAEAGYLKVLDDRPVLYLGFLSEATIERIWGDVATLRAALDAFRTSVRQKGLNDPYIVIIDFNPARGQRWMDALGCQALSSYATSAGGQGAPFQELADHAERFWERCQATGAQVVPIIMSGWDRRPRVEHPVPWEAKQKAGEGIEKYYEAPKPDELARHVSRALQWIEQNPESARAQLSIIYAWNENDEGGWLIPTLQEGTTRLDALARVLREPKPKE